MKTKKITCMATIGLGIISIAACHAKPNDNNIYKEKVNAVALRSHKQTQLEFEDDYLKGTLTYGEGTKFALGMLSGIGSIVAGAACNQPVAIVGGIFGILTSVNDQFGGGQGPTIQDVMNKLDEMDKKLDGISEKIDENYNQLMNETIRTQAKVDEVLLEEMEQAINNFNTSYVVPIENHTRDYSDYLEQSYKAYVKKPETVDLYVYKVDDEWALRIIDEKVEDLEEIRFEIPEFAKAKESLERNYNIVTKGFMDDFIEDIDKALEKQELPEGLDKGTCRNYVVADLTQKITKQYYQENHQKALDLRNMAINYSKQISGKQVKSIIDRYTSRLEYIYNFAGEMKDTATDLMANMMYDLDTKVTLAAQACLYAEVSQEEIRTEYMAARELIQRYYENIQSLEDNLCFTTKSVLAGGFYQAKFEVSYTNKGNNCKSHSELVINKVSGGNAIKFTKINPNEHDYLDPIDHTRIITRRRLMGELGYEIGENYIDYLKINKAMDIDAYSSYKFLHQIGWVSTDALRIFTGLEMRGLSDSDKNLRMTCMACGNPGADYFSIGWNGNFRSKKTSGCWSGKIAETTYLDAMTGEILTEKKVAAYAVYNESHWYWINDEHWAFVDNPCGNYFFAVENI